MLKTRLWTTVALAGLTCGAKAQVFNIPSSTNKYGSAFGLDATQTTTMDFSILEIDSRDSSLTPFQSRSGSVSKLDLKAPMKAQREYARGYQSLMKKDLQAAVSHLSNSLTIYPKYVAAHNALGTTYLDLGQNQQARDEFTTAVGLDDHLPNSFLNLGCASLALKQYPEAEDAFRKASDIAPLDRQLLMARAYGEFANHDYPAVLATTQQVHAKKHDGTAMVHYFAAGALAAQDKLSDAQREMETLLREDPKSPNAAEFRQILETLKTQQAMQAEAKLHPAQPVTFSFNAPAQPTAAEASRQAQQMLQDVKEKNQIAEAEAAPDATAPDAVVSPSDSTAVPDSISVVRRPATDSGVATFRASVDEVAMFFAATDRGKSVTDLTASDVKVRDDGKPPHTILGFRNEAELPLRLGLVIDTSESVTDRFAFEQGAAVKFLQAVMTKKDDLAFVIGVNNSVLLVRDFTGDLALASHAVNQLAPGGGTALWDAMEFAAEKLKSRAETQPVARILVVISDGKDNSSSSSLKDTIAAAQRGEVAVYTVSTREELQDDSSSMIGDRALRTASELTGGASFVPGSIRRLSTSLGELQQVIRGRYLVSYKPESFQRDGKYRAIEINAQKAGRKLKVYSRKGYYASAASSNPVTP